MHVFEQICASFRIRGTTYFEAQFARPWGMEFVQGAVANFHFVTSGACDVVFNGSSHRMEVGDAVLFPQGSSHKLSDGGSSIVPAQTLIDETARQDESGKLVFGGQDDVSTTLVCGHFEYGSAVVHPLWTALPPMILMNGLPDRISALAVAMIEKEIGDDGTSAAIVDRIAELLLLEMIRAHVANDKLATGFGAAMRDQAIGLALQAIHQNISTGWTIERLARKAAMSRSTFSEKFRFIVGMPPMEYLTELRLQTAKELLKHSASSLAEVAEQIGYATEFGFSKAFKRRFGTSPGKVRKKVP